MATMSDVLVNSCGRKIVMFCIAVSRNVRPVLNKYLGTVLPSMAVQEKQKNILCFLHFSDNPKCRNETVLLSAVSYCTTD